MTFWQGLRKTLIMNNIPNATFGMFVPHNPQETFSRYFLIRVQFSKSLDTLALTKIFFKNNFSNVKHFLVELSLVIVVRCAI